MNARQIIWKHPKLPMIIERIEIPKSLIKFINNSKTELEELILNKSDGLSNTWGYFPEINQSKTEYKNTLGFEKEFRTILNNKTIYKDVPLELAFVRRATSEPVSDFGGFHIDASAGIGHEWPKNISKSKHVLRLLFNLDIHKRHLAYYPLTTDELKEKNIKISREKYEILNLNEIADKEQIDILPIEENAVYALSFVSTMIPHAGKTSDEGHFLISYGAYIDNNKINLLF